MLKQEVDTVNAEDGAEAVTQSQQNRAQVQSVFATTKQIDDGSDAEGRAQIDPGFEQKSKELYATPEATKTREEGRKVLLDVVNPRFHATALQAPIAYQSGARAHARYDLLKDGTKVSKANLFSPDSSVSVFLHEYAHSVEHNSAEVTKLANDFLDKRVAGETPTKLKAKFGNSYGDHELGRKDDFQKAFDAVNGASTTGAKEDNERSAYYTGKASDWKSTEVISMGIELLYKNPQAFAEADPEYFDLVTGVLSGRALTQARGL